MSIGDIFRKNKIKLIKYALLLIVLIIVALIIVSIISIATTGTFGLSGIFSRRSSGIYVDEFNFDVGRERVFAYSDGSVAAAGTLGVKVLDSRGNETLRDAFRMTRPAISHNGNRFIAYDIGGSNVRVFNRTQVTSSIEVEGIIVSASINQNGWFCIVSQDGGNNKGTVTVYNNHGNAVYGINFGSGFVLSAVLSPDNKSVAILNLSETGSRINFYHGLDADKLDPDYIFDIYGGLIIDIKYLHNTDLLAISMDSLFLVESDGSGRMLYSYSDKNLIGYTYDKDFIALHLNDYGVGNQGRLVTFLTDGTSLGEITFNRDIISMSAVDRSLVILKSDGVLFYNGALEELPVSSDSFSAAGAIRVLALNENTALATSDHSAVVVRREKER